MQNYKRKIAIITLISVLTVILLYINYTIWSGSYIVGDLEDNIRQEMHLIKESHFSDYSSVNEIIYELKHQLSGCLVSGMMNSLLIICGIFLVIRINQSDIQSNTLVALSVRLNNWNSPYIHIRRNQRRAYVMHSFWFIFGAENRRKL